MPIRVDHSPSAGAIGAGALFAGQGNPDDAAKRAQISLQAMQMNADAQAKSQALATQLYMSQQGHDYDLYSRLAGMDNENQQLQFRTAADMAKQQYGTEADFASQYNQQQNANAQLQYRTEADFASQFNQQQNQRAMQEDSQNFQEGGMRFQAEEQKQRQQEEFRLRDELEKNQLQRHEQARLDELKRKVDWVQMQDTIKAEDKQLLIQKMQTDIDPLQMRMQKANIAGQELQNLTMARQAEEALKWSMKSLTDTIVHAYNEETGGTDQYLQMAPGRYSPGGGALKHDYPSAGGGSSGSGSSSSGGTGAGRGMAPKAQEEPPKQNWLSTAKTEADAYVGERKDLLTPEDKQKWVDRFDSAYQREANEWKERQNVLQQQMKEQNEATLGRPQTKTTYQMLPPLDKRMVSQTADDLVAREYPGLKSKDPSSFALKKSAMVETITTNVYGDGTKPTIPKDSQMPNAGASGKATLPDPITPDRIEGKPGAKPLDPIQSKMIDALGKATIQAWSIDAPLEMKQVYAKDASEGIALFKKYGSLAAMEAASPQDFARWNQIDKQMDDLNKRAERSTRYAPATSGDFREYASRHPMESINRGTMDFLTSGATSVIGRDRQRQLVEERMRAEGIVKPQMKPLPATSGEAEAAARESDRQYQLLKQQKAEQQQSIPEPNVGDGDWP